MAIELVKRGAKVDLTKGVATKKFNVALGWDTNKYHGAHDFDLDVSVFMAMKAGTDPYGKDIWKVRDEEDFIFYGKTEHATGSVIHTGDNRTGDANGDDEVIKVDFNLIPAHVEKLAFVVTIYEADARKQNFGMVSNSYVRIDNGETGEQLKRFDLGEDFSTQTGVAVCELYKHNGEWKMNAIGAGYDNGLAGFVKDYGLEVKQQ